MRTPVLEPIPTPAAVRKTTPIPVPGPTPKPVLRGAQVLRPSVPQSTRNLFGKRPVGRTKVAHSAGRGDWDTYAQLLRLYLAGVGQSPSLLALAAETEAYYCLAEDRSDSAPALP